MEIKRLRVLVVDDDEDDFMITRELLSDVEGWRFDLDWGSSYDEGLEAIAQAQHDVYLLDYRLGGHSGLELLREAIARGCKGPMILLTGQGGHEVDMEAAKAGAMDYLVKGQINTAQLERSIRYAIERSLAQRQLEQVIADLKDALANIKTLSGLLPICASCKRIRDDTGYWNQIETYIQEHSSADFSHSICPPCMKRLYPDQYAKLFPDETKAAQ